MSDIALALAADAWSRTEHIDVEAVSPSGPVTMRSGLKLIAQPVAGDMPRLPLAQELRPVQQLDRTLSEIGEHFGDARRQWVMQELEYPRNDTCATE
jgi:hypothetical protein